MPSSDINVPLLNDYKKDFVFRRLLATFLGGPKLWLGFSAPFYAYAAQVLVWLFPYLIGGIFSLVTELSNLDVLYGSIIAGCVVFAFVVFLQVVHVIYSRRQVSAVTDLQLEEAKKTQFHQLLADDDEIFFPLCWSYTTFKFTIPAKRCCATVFVHAIFSGVLCGVAVWYLVPQTLNNLYGYQVASTVLLFLFSWIPVCIAQYPLMVGGMLPEIATYRSDDALEFSSMSRAFHVFIFYAFHIVEVFVPSFRSVNQVLHVVFAFLPLLWLSGIMPSIEALLLWALEQVFVFALGGSPMSTNFRLLVASILAGLVVLVSSFLPSVEALTIFSALFGFVLSNDITSLVIRFAIYLANVVTKKSSTAADSAKQANFVTNWSDGLIILFVFSAHTIVACVSTIYRTNLTSSSTTKLAFHVIFLLLLVIAWILREIQRVFVFFSVFRNIFYPHDMTSSQFRQERNRLNGFGYLFTILSMFLCPLLMACYISAYLFWGTHFATPPSFLSAVLAVHAFRLVWQRSSDALYIITTVGVIELIVTYSNVSLGWFDDAALGVKMIVLDVSLDRSFRFFRNLWLAMTIVATSYRDKKQRRKSSLQLVILNSVFFAVVISIAAIASLLSAPLLPFFTLPLFYIAYPRPSRFWPEDPGRMQASECPDTSAYRLLAPMITSKLSIGVRNGSYSSTCGSGTDLPFYLVRVQDKSVWVQMLESGYSYVSYSVKGLELQETSCHALEATKIDDMCAEAFEKSQQEAARVVNSEALLSVITPLDTVLVDSYSDAKNSLVGIIDNLAAIKRVHQDFVNAITWLLVRNYSPSPVQSRANSRAGDVSRASAKVDSMSRQSKVSAWSKSSVKSTWSSVDEYLEATQPQPATGLPGTTRSSSDDDMLSVLTLSENGDVQYGLPAGFKNLKPPEPPKKAYNSAITHNIIQVTPTNSEIMLLQNVFSDADGPKFDQFVSPSFYQLILEQQPSKSNLHDLQSQTCIDGFRKKALRCYSVMFASKIPGGDTSFIGASHLCKVFADDIPWSADLDWLRSNPQTHSLALKAFRYSIKLMYDRAAMGMSDEEADDEEATMALLLEYEDECHVGAPGTPEWDEAMKQGKDTLFSVSYNSEKREYSARMMMRRKVESHVTKLSAAAVRSIWSNLVFELFYLTNDDDERYSIQAQTNLLRNLTTQAADPPLGYPIFSSSPMYESKSILS